METRRCWLVLLFLSSGWSCPSYQPPPLPNKMPIRLKSGHISRGFWLPLSRQDKRCHLSPLPVPAGWQVTFTRRMAAACHRGTGRGWYHPGQRVCMHCGQRCRVITGSGSTDMCWMSVDGRWHVAG